MTKLHEAGFERARGLRAAAWLCLLVGILLVGSRWHWHSMLAGLILVVTSVGLFCGKIVALHVALWCGRACLLLIAPFELWPELRLHVWNAPVSFLQIWLRTDFLPVALLLGLSVLLEISRHRLRERLSPWWSTVALAACALVVVGRAVPAALARRQVDPVAWEQARLLVQAVEQESRVKLHEWWKDAPWKELMKTPAWERPVMRCSWYTLPGIGGSLGDWGIGPWFRHPKAGQAPGMVDYQFRDGSRWRGVEITRYVTSRAGHRMQVTLELRISHSPPDPDAALPEGSAPELFPES